MEPFWKRARDVTGTPKTRLRADLGAPRASQERPGAVRKRPWASPERLPDRPAAVSERVWSIERCRTCSRNDCWSFLHWRAEAPMCVSYQFLQCFVGFERPRTQTHARGEKVRKSTRFGFKNRAQERPGEPKSGSSGQVRAAKRAKARDFFVVGANEPIGAPVGARKYELLGG